MKAFFYFILILFAVLLSLAFTVLNPGDVEVDLYLNQFQIPFSIVVVVSIVIGIMFGVLASIATIISVHHKLRRSRKQLRKAQDQLALQKNPLAQT